MMSGLSNALQSHLEDIIDQLSPEADKFPTTLYDAAAGSTFSLWAIYHQRADTQGSCDFAGAQARLKEEGLPLN